MRTESDAKVNEGASTAAPSEIAIPAREAQPGRPSRSSFGPHDEIGMLNLADSEAVRQVITEVDPRKVFDLAVDYFVGMPSWTKWGDPPFQIAMTATPRGEVADGADGPGTETVSRTSDAISMFSHCGTHVDALNHFGYRGEIWNGFHEHDHLGSRHWRVAGADRHPPIVARGVLVDVAGAHGVDVLPDSYAIGGTELQRVLDAQRIELRPGDVVLVRTGRMRRWPDSDGYNEDEPGIDRGGARLLAESGAMLIGADNIGLEAMPSADPHNGAPVHTYLLAEAGVPILEIADLEELAADEVYEFAFIGACLRIRGATGSPMRPIALPLRS